jgi:hypothetical protein
MGGGADGGGMKAIKAVVAGGIAGTITKTSVAPLERIKIILQVHAARCQSSDACIAFDPTCGMSFPRLSELSALYRSRV